MLLTSTRSSANGHLGDFNPEYPVVSIIVVGYNSRRHLERCFSALRRTQYPGNIEQIFVDNQSCDDSVAFMQQHYPEVVVVPAGQNLGYAGGNNLGAARASGSMLVFLNPDTEVDPNWLIRLIQPVLEQPEIGLTTSKVLMMSDRSTINTCGNEVSFAGITWCRGAGCRSDEFVVDSDVSAVSGCAFAIRRQLFEELGGFDERFFMYLEDTDLSWRARVAGYRCRYVADSIVYHDYHLDLTPWKIGLIEQNRYRMLGKHLSLRGIVGLAPALISAEVLTWGYALLRGPRSVLAKARATAWAFTQLGPVIRTRWRPIEGTILRDHALAPPVVAGLGGRPSLIAQQAIHIISRATTALSLRLLPAVARPVNASPAMALDRNGQNEFDSTIDGHVRDALRDSEHSGLGLR